MDKGESVRRNARWRFGSLGVLVVALWLGLLLAGSSARIHHLFHGDGHAPEHSCAIEHVSHGAFHFEPAIDILRASDTHWHVSFQFGLVPHFSCDFRVSQSRAPPSGRAFRPVAG